MDRLVSATRLTTRPTTRPTTRLTTRPTTYDKLTKFSELVR